MNADRLLRQAHRQLGDVRAQRRTYRELSLVGQIFLRQQIMSVVTGHTSMDTAIETAMDDIGARLAARRIDAREARRV